MLFFKQALRKLMSSKVLQKIKKETVNSVCNLSYCTVYCIKIESYLAGSSHLPSLLHLFFYLNFLNQIVKFVEYNILNNNLKK